MEDGPFEQAIGKTRRRTIRAFIAISL